MISGDVHAAREGVRAIDDHDLAVRAEVREPRAEARDRVEPGDVAAGLAERLERGARERVRADPIEDHAHLHARLRALGERRDHAAAHVVAVEDVVLDVDVMPRGANGGLERVVERVALEVERHVGGRQRRRLASGDGHAGQARPPRVIELLVELAHRAQEQARALLSLHLPPPQAPRAEEVVDEDADQGQPGEDADPRERRGGRAPVEHEADRDDDHPRHLEHGKDRRPERHGPSASRGGRHRRPCRGEPLGRPRDHATPSSSTSNTSVAPPGITPGKPPAP